MATTNEIYSLYLAYFGRPPDAVGFAAAQSKSVAQLQSEFSASAESAALLGSTNLATQVNNIYVNAFGRSAETAGLLYWVGEIAANRVTLSQAAFTIVSSALNDDRTTVTNKITAATAFYAQVVASPANIIGYSGNAASAQARTFLSSVTSSAASVTAAVAGVAAAVTSTVAAGSAATVTPGSTFTLTTGVDSGTAFTGTAGNDTFNAANAAGTAAGQTLNIGDVLNGGTGTDTLNATIAVAASLANVTSIENINITDVAGTTTSLLGSTGVTSVASSGSTVATTFNDIGATSVGLAVRNTGVGATFNFAAAAVEGTADSATLTISNQTAGTNVIAGIETLNVVSTGGPNVLTGLTAAAATTINISGDTTLNLGAANTVARTIASTNTAGVTLTSNVAGGLGVTVTGGAGNDTITLTEGAAANNNVNGGAGNDTITFTANLDTTDTVAGGDGTDTLVAASTDITDTYTRISGFERLQVSNDLAAALTTANVQAGIDRINLRGTSGGQTITFEAGSKVLDLRISNGANALVVSDTGSATTDALTIQNSSTNVNVTNGQALTVTGFETVTYNGSTETAAAATQTFGAISITPDAGGSVTLNFTGNNSVTTGTITATSATAGVVSAAGLTGTSTFTNTGAVGITSITGSGNADVIVGSATATTIDGGAGNDNLTGGAAADSIVGAAGDDTIAGAAGNDVLSGGDGNDQITAGAGNDNLQGGAGNDTLVFAGDLAAGDSADGGEGTDVLSVTDASLNTVNGLSISAAVALNGAISNVERVTVSDRLGRSVDVARLDAIENITLTAGINGNQTLSGFSAAGGNVTILGASNATTDQLTLAVSTNSAADSFTVNLTNDNSTNFAQVTVNDVETLNIVTAQATAAAAVVTATLAVNANVTDNTIGLTTLNISGTENLAINGVAINATTVNATGLTSTGSGATAALNFLGGNAASTINLGGGADTVDGGAGNDTINGAGGADTLTGGSGEDSISGGDGADTLIGGSENDVLNGGEGTDSLRGGLGNDSIVLTETTSVADTVVIGATRGTAGNDESARVTVAGNNNDTGADTITGMTWGTDVIQIVATDVDSFNESVDVFIGTAVGDVNDGTAGSFLTNVGLIELNQTANNTIEAGGDIAINFTSPSAALTTARLRAALQYNITGQNDADTIVTGALADTITGGAGVDVVTGGAGADTFVFAAGANGAAPSGTVFDEITDFISGTDIIDFGATAIVQFATVTAAAAGTAGVTAAGVVSFDAADATLAARITAVASSIAGAAAGNSLIFGVGADSYIYVTDGTAGVGANDVVIKLTGIANAAATDTLTISGGDITALA